MKHLPNGTTQWYKGAEGEVEFVNESRNILLSNVSCADSGVYVCHLAAPVGEQNREGRVLLALTGKSLSELADGKKHLILWKMKDRMTHCRLYI